MNQFSQTNMFLLSRAFLVRTGLATLLAVVGVLSLLTVIFSSPANAQTAQTIFENDFNSIPTLDTPLVNDGSEGFTTDLFHRDSDDDIYWDTASPSGSEYVVASDALQPSVGWGVVTNGTDPNPLPLGQTEPDGNFLVINSFTTVNDVNQRSGGIAVDDNDGDGITGELLSSDNIVLKYDGTYQFGVFLSDATNVGNNDNFYNFDIRDSVSGALIASGSNGLLPADDIWHLVQFSFAVDGTTFAPGNTGRQVDLILRQNTNLDNGADIVVDNFTLVFIEDPKLDLNMTVASVSTANGDSTTLTDLGDTITYNYTIQNTGNVTIEDVAVDNPLPVINGVTGTGTFSSFTVTSGPDADLDGRADSLAPGQTATYTATYTLSQTDIDNTATAGAGALTAIDNTASPTGVSVDAFNTPTGVAPATTSDTTETGFTIAPSIEMELVDDTSALSTPVVPNDVVSYTYTVENTGNVTLALDTIAPITPTLTDADGTSLTLTTAPAFEGPASSLGSAEGTLLPGEVATYTATYTLTQSDIDAGGLSQTATVDGTDPNATVVTATSDDPADLTGAADATVTPLAPAPAVSMELVDDTSALSTPVAEGDVVTYTYTVTNDGNVTLALDTIAPITPTLTDADGTALTLTTAPAFEGPASS
ncbi:DUF7507 domain-containing protein, partial [Actibacterium lipolyticum]|uniref:DUF7507 domain-containing protein n=1 Tax=Actibacterium lipolyticum TaxID=1524263 RepID=UPI003F95E00E